MEPSTPDMKEVYESSENHSNQLLSSHPSIISHPFDETDRPAAAFFMETNLKRVSNLLDEGRADAKSDGRRFLPGHSNPGRFPSDIFFLSFGHLPARFWKPETFPPGLHYNATQNKHILLTVCPSGCRKTGKGKVRQGGMSGREKYVKGKMSYTRSQLPTLLSQ